MDSKNGIFGAAKGLVPPAQFQVPLTNHVPHPTLMPFSMSQTSRNTSFPDQPSAVTATAAHQVFIFSFTLHVSYVSCMKVDYSEPN